MHTNTMILNQTVHNIAQWSEHYIFFSSMYHPLIWVTNSNLTLVSQTSNLPQQCNNCQCPLHHLHLPRYYPAKPTTHNIHTFQINTNFWSPPPAFITYKKNYIVRRQFFLNPPSRPLSANATASIHASTPYSKLKTFIMLLLFVLKLTTFSIPLTLNTFQLQTFFINFSSSLKPAECLPISRVPYCQQTVLVSAECLTVSRLP